MIDQGGQQDAKNDGCRFLEAGREYEGQELCLVANFSKRDDTRGDEQRFHGEYQDGMTNMTCDESCKMQSTTHIGFTEVPVSANHSPMNHIKIFHNPACGTSRNVLALIRHAGIEPEVIEYLKTPPAKEELRALAAATGEPLRALLREKGTPYAELGLGDTSLSDDALLDFIGQHPILLNRPLVVTPLGTKLCRPSEAVLEILPVPPLPPFTKEDGEPVVDPGVRRQVAS